MHFHLFGDRGATYKDRALLVTWRRSTRSSADVDHLSLGAHYGRPWNMSMKEPKEGTDDRCLPSTS